MRQARGSAAAAARPRPRSGGQWSSASGSGPAPAEGAPEGSATPAGLAPELPAGSASPRPTSPPWGDSACRRGGSPRPSLQPAADCPEPEVRPHRTARAPLSAEPEQSRARLSAKRCSAVTGYPRSRKCSGPGPPAAGPLGPRSVCPTRPILRRASKPESDTAARRVDTALLRLRNRPNPTDRRSSLRRPANPPRTECLPRRPPAGPKASSDQDPSDSSARRYATDSTTRLATMNA